MFNPLNRHLLVEQIKREAPEKEESLVLVPDSYSIKKSPYGTYTILKLAPDCEKLKKEHINCSVVVDESMVQEITIDDQRYYLVLENYIYGTFK
jgi:hypothetical protein